MSARNVPTPQGRLLGAQLGRLTEMEIVIQQRRFPSMKDKRCASCAFTAGTFPNGCPEAIMDALSCLTTGEPFYCHHDMEDGKPTKICAGWMYAIGAMTRVPATPEMHASAAKWKALKAKEASATVIDFPPTELDQQIGGGGL